MSARFEATLSLRPELCYRGRGGKTNVIREFRLKSFGCINFSVDKRSIKLELGFSINVTAPRIGEKEREGGRLSFETLDRISFVFPRYAVSYSRNIFKFNQ